MTDFNFHDRYFNVLDPELCPKIAQAYKEIMAGKNTIRFYISELVDADTILAFPSNRETLEDLLTDERTHRFVADRSAIKQVDKPSYPFSQEFSTNDIN